MKIKMVVMDVDGTLTDGKIYIGPKGEAMKVFNVKDGYGITKLLFEGIIPVIITGRESDSLVQRTKELKIDDVYQGINNKVEKLLEVAKKYSCSCSEIAYIGDDENDYECMNICGFKGCPADASNLILNVSNFISIKKGGEGAVREFIDEILLINGKRENDK